jgi:Bifunctional DNA primase/polymerase, N-terminal
MSEPSIYDINAPRLIRLGLCPLPIGPGTKIPHHWVPSLGRYEKTCGWDDPRRPLETAPQPHAGIGVRLGRQVDGTYLVALDWDNEDAAIAAMDVFPPTVTKEGARGFTAFYRSTVAVTSRDFRIGGRVVVQVLSDGRQTVLPPTVHPDTGRPYVWTSKYSLYDLPLTELPGLPQ